VVVVRFVGLTPDGQLCDRRRIQLFGVYRIVIKTELAALNPVTAVVVVGTVGNLV